MNTSILLSHFKYSSVKQSHYFKSLFLVSSRCLSDKKGDNSNSKSSISNQVNVHPNTPLGILDRVPKKADKEINKQQANGDANPDAFARFEDNTNPASGEIGGPTGPEPTRYGDWERKGRVSDF